MWSHNEDRAGKRSLERGSERDGLALHARPQSQDQPSLTFCVSDGVGGSYRGDFAAYDLAHCLIDWLQALPGLHSDLQEAATELEKQLHSWQGKGQAELQNLLQPANIPEFLKEQQEKYGSETVFFGGRIDSTMGVHHQRYNRRGGSSAGWAMCQHNSSSRQKNTLLLGGDLGGEQDRNRWSTRYGPRGILTCLKMKLDMVERLIIHTDGLDTISMELASLDDDALQTRTRAILQSATNDDMTLLDIQW